ncbi:MAG TPA: prolipoprotein diacylglyceryl transferase, partial [Clostridia bacterium]|nr:prolipoprotein diacylglyceryl transferase [Clostridia bacterium]
MSRPPLGSIAFGNIPWYSVLIVTAVAIGIWLAGREERRLDLPKDSALDFVLWAVPLAIIGARLYYVAFRWSDYAGDLWRILNIREGGLAIYGAVLGGLL